MHGEHYIAEEIPPKITIFNPWRLKRPLFAGDSTGETQSADTQTGRDSIGETQPARLNLYRENRIK